MQVNYRSITLPELRRLCLEQGADDAGAISIERPELNDQRDEILRFFPFTRTLLSFVCRMNREPIRNAARSVANLEFHHTGDRVNEIAGRVVATLERQGIRAINPPMGFPMEADRWPGKLWIVGHKPVAVAAGLGQMGTHRNVIHPKFGNFILLGTVLLAVEIADGEQSQPLDYNPCLRCMLCVAACPVGAIGQDGSFNFSSCYHHNYREFMGGFTDWVEQVAESRSRVDYRKKVSAAETVSIWQSLGFGPNYKSAYCVAVCPAGDDVVAAYRLNKAEHTREILRPLQDKKETLYAVRGSDGEAYARKRFPHKSLKLVRSNLLPSDIEGFLRGLSLTFQPGASKGLAARYHFIFTNVPGAKPGAKIEATVEIRDQKIVIQLGLKEKPDLLLQADAKTWLRYLRGESSIMLALLLRKVRVHGSLRLLQAFARCFPAGRKA
jgi:Fe-S-cluster-containing hydrogenase component 2